jgi:hypothetical protein
VGVKSISDKNDYYIWKEHKKGIEWNVYFICKSIIQFGKNFTKMFSSEDQSKELP